MKTRSLLHPLGATLALLLACHAAAAQVATLVERDSRQTGNFAVGFGGDTDSDSYLLDLTGLDPAFANVASDGGSAGAAPDAASASFSTSQAYTLFDDRLEFSGSAVTEVAAPLANMVAFAQTLSQLELALVLTEATPFELRIDVDEVLGAAVNGLAPRADAQVRLTGPGGSWLFNTSGSFLETGVLAPGTWRINAFADTRGNGSASFIGTLALAPVPEPAAWLLMALGGGALLLRRRQP
jgi:hypothetical protein